jgi:hypothetical protein
LIVLFVLILAFVGVTAAMQALMLTSVASTSRAFDSHRQGMAELSRLERAVTEAVLEQRQISALPAPASLAEGLQHGLRSLGAGNVTVTSATPDLPAIATFPPASGTADPLVEVSSPLLTALTPELAMLSGPRIASYPEIAFEFASERTVLDVSRIYRSRVTAQLVAVPLTRFPISAYELPSDLGSGAGAIPMGPESQLPAGIVPARDPAFLAALQARPGTLPYHYRRRASLAASYQYLFSQAFIDRVAEYAGVTHFRDLDNSGSATLSGMVSAGAQTTWDLGVAGDGTYQTIHDTRDAAVVFTRVAGKAIRLRDSLGRTDASGFFVLLLGPADKATGPLDVILESISRPVVIVGANIRVTAVPGTGISGALFLDPSSAITAGTQLGVGHFSYWCGTSLIPRDSVAATTMPLAAEAIAPRVVYVATRGLRL